MWQPSSPRKHRRQRKVTWRSKSTPTKPPPDEPVDLFVLNPKDITLIHTGHKQQQIKKEKEISVDWTTPVLLPDSVDIRNTDLGEKAPDTALKVGVLAQAKADLMTAINRLPQLASAYWQLHLVSLIEGNIEQALIHLDRYLKCTLSARSEQTNKLKKQLEVAYLFKIKIHELLKDSQSELLAWKELILLNPRQYIYYRQRALLLLKLNQPTDAFCDLEKALSLNPADRETRNWGFASNYFQQFNERWPDDSDARAYLGRTCMHLRRYAEALAELTASLYFNPLNVEALCASGQLLRRVAPLQALRDLTLCIQLAENEMKREARLHRAILLFELKSAILHFTQAIQTTFTGWKVYLCRAEAYHALGKTALAAIDVQRCILLHPCKADLYILLCHYRTTMKQIPHESSCVTQLMSAALHKIGRNARQKALAYCLLNQYENAADILLSDTVFKPKLDNLILLSIVQQKMNKLESAIISLQRGLQLLVNISQKSLIYTIPNQCWLTNLPFLIQKPSSPKCPWPLKAAELHETIGRCLVQLKAYDKAIHSFTNAIKINSKSIKVKKCLLF
ncbi:hypothetical protein PHET_06583 [Paragonimus heterotremus]|uniref:Tetratricopeptide repeat protein n=1 Tax=Paragonimus heterotremus TaxID=100268 RepID=A0A8J4T8T5_9TREM|nr:hypothetical protein PHET_06583 [Paragonimus heterotremus]